MRQQCPALLPLRLLFQLVNNIHKVLLPALPSSYVHPQRSTHAKVAMAAIDGAAYVSSEGSSKLVRVLLRVWEPIKNIGSSLLAILFSVFSLVVAANFYQDFDLTWSDGRGKVLNNGQLLTLSLDKASGSGFQSKNEYLFGKIDMQIKLIPGNSVGTVTTYYVIVVPGADPRQDRLRVLGKPTPTHCTPTCSRRGRATGSSYSRSSSTKDFHTYSILWNPQHILVSVDGIPIRDFRNNEARGVPFPKNQPMRIYSSLWNADDCATWGGFVKTDCHFLWSW
ncbi:hypothetical protein Taro_014950 [Colocasia esculenta]|uniref:GH16 domain-containing protein n=1 Tax=Colocasia esculenta TaxID=4460 RepID=A0A843UKR2_COLES|nr:hypothetical protein [Colocasia esculenta]